MFAKKKWQKRNIKLLKYLKFYISFMAINFDITGL